ncbi:MAG: hypothetical protein AABY22_22230, partial [Nanoarchaeota archaeon]
EHTIEPVTLEKIRSLEKIGQRNYLISPTIQNYDFVPTWAEPKIQSLVDSLTKVYEDKNYRENIAYQGRTTAESLTWEKTSINLAHILSI